MKKLYFIVQNGNQLNPLTFEELVHFKFLPGTKIWTKGMLDWEVVSNLQEVLLKINEGTNAVEKQHLTNEISHTRLNANLTKSSNGRISNVVNGNTPASPAIRLIGYILHWLIIFMIITFFSRILDVDEGSAFILLLVIALPTYYFWSGNLAHKILGLKVVNIDTGEDFNNPFFGALREAIKMIFMLFIIPNLWVLWDNKNQNLYDKIFNTVVVNNKKSHQ